MATEDSSTHDQMNNLTNKRHTLAHLLAAAVHDLYPHAKPTIGPAIDNGFFYDFDFSGGAMPGTDELATIQTKMIELLPSWIEFEHTDISAAGAHTEFANNQYKIELITALEADGAPIKLYTCGGFTDLCRGGHCEHPSIDITPDSFKLDKVAGAYWRGDEKNAMLTRIYGLAYETKEELDTFIMQREEAIKRDHRKIAREQGLLVFSDLVGPGMPMYTPKGNVVRNAIINYSRELNERLGFGEVHTPNVNKAELFKISGHYDAYKEDMLTVSSQYVSDEMFLKPMNCPQHTQIYASAPRSYRDLPVRFADFANLYRDERPGQLSGLTRLRAFAQDDGHIFCREDQVETELLNVLKAIQDALSTYQIDYWVRLSLRDSTKKEGYLGTDESWEQSQGQLRKVIESSGIKFKAVEGEAAFYAPKLDIMAVDALGREWQISTIQVDRNMPGRFELEYTAEDGTKQTPVMIHRALIGSPDRFLGILIEHYAGVLPVWLSPLHAKVLPVSEKHTEYAQELVQQLKNAGIRAELSDGDSLGKRIRAAKIEKVPYMLVIGDQEITDSTATLEGREGKIGALSITDIISRLQQEIKTRKV
jgi:threonyl-tRNA synthetase